MRLRNDPLAVEKLAAYPRLTEAQVDDADLRKSWREIFGNEHPLCLEIGVGRGRFLAAMTETYPERNFVGIALRRELLVEAAHKLTDYCANARLLLLNADELGGWFDDGELARIYINFPDPWPKKGHAKRRLTYRRFLALYSHLLQTGGTLELRTDQTPLFNYMLTELAALEHSGLRAEVICRDFHGSPYFRDDLTTEYEEKKSRQAPICYACLRKE